MRLFPFFDWEQIRLGSVLGRIGIAGFITTVLYLNFDSMKRLMIVGVILLLYYAAVFLIPVPGFGAGDLSFEGNLIGWFDRTFLPGRLLQGQFDEFGNPDHLSGNLSHHIGSIWRGILKTSSLSQNQKTEAASLNQFDLRCSCIGMESSFPDFQAIMDEFIHTLDFWNVLPIPRPILLGHRYPQIPKMVLLLCDCRMNSLTIYMIYRFVNFRYTSRLLFEGLYKPLDETWYPVMESLGALALVWLFLYFLYQKKIFFKV